MTTQQFDIVGSTEYLGYAAPQVFSGYAAPMPGRELIHQNQPSTGGLDSVREWLDKEIIKGVPNKFLVAGGALVGILAYGYQDGWFR